MSEAPVTEPVDRARAVRQALRALVARSGFHGASMSAVAREAGVATGTAYVHYASKDELVVAAYLETKASLGRAAVAGADAAAPPRERFVSLWLALHDHLARNRDDARFLVQVEHSPYAAIAHERALEGEDDPLRAAARDLQPLLAPLPREVLWELGLAPAVRLAAAEMSLTRPQLQAAALACWRAITRDDTAR